jgi:serine/threonine-protein kinase RsbW
MAGNEGSTLNHPGSPGGAGTKDSIQEPGTPPDVVRAGDRGADRAGRAGHLPAQSSPEPVSTWNGWEPPAIGGVVELTVPAQTAFLDVVRTATAGLAARLSLTLDDIEDLRSMVNEACAMVLSLPGPPPPDAALTCRYEILPDALAVRVSAPVDAAAAIPAEQSFAWRVLTTHATGVSGAVADGHAWIELRMPRRR